MQIVTDAVSGFHEGEYLEGEERASHSFTGLCPGTYTVLVYGMDREEVSISPLDGPDYVSVVRVSGPRQTPVATEMPMPSMNCHSIIIGNFVVYHYHYFCIDTPMGTISSSLFAEGTI